MSRSQADIKVNSNDRKGQSPLALAAYRGHGAKVNLSCKGIDFKSTDQYGDTAPSNAASNGHEDVVKLLLRYPGIGVDGKDQY